MRRLVVAQCLMSLAFVVSVKAQTVSGVSAARFQTADCKRLVLATPGRKRPSPEELVRVVKCLKEMGERADSARARVSRDAPSRTTSTEVSLLDTLPADQVNEFLITEHVAYKRLKDWVKKARRGIKDDSLRTHTDLVDAQIALEEASDKLHAALDARGLNQSFSAKLVSGMIVSSGSSDAPQGTSEADKQKDAAAHLVWESKHYGAESRSFDAAFRGKIGFMPALLLVADSARATQADATTESVYQEAFVWDVGGKVSYPFALRTGSELSITARAGQHVLGTKSVLLERGGASQVVVPIRNGAGQAEWFYEAGVEYQLYNNPLDVVHAEGSAVSPIFLLGLAFRRDNRFRQDGALAAFDAPEQRMVFRFLIDALKVFDGREVAETPKSFTFGFGVEHEWGTRGGIKVPSGTRFMFRGDIDLLRALRGR